MFTQRPTPFPLVLLAEALAFNFSTAFHSRNSPPCDEQPLLTAPHMCKTGRMPTTRCEHQSAQSIIGLNGEVLGLEYFASKFLGIKILPGSRWISDQQAL